MKPVEDITGRRFGRIVVLEDAGPGYPRNHYWKVRCDCGTVFEVAGSALRSGRTRSCGCLRKEIARSHCPALHAATRVPVVATDADGVQLRYSSLTEAADGLQVPLSTASTHLRNGKPLKGFTLNRIAKYTISH